MIPVNEPHISKNALKYVSEQTAEDVGSYKDGLIDTMTDVELSEAEEFANQIGVRGTA